MSDTRAEDVEHGGKLVAVEGDHDTIATQLRLLPPSQKILILPSLVDTIPEDKEQQSFNSRAFVRKVHTIYTQRTERARTFLQSSTKQQPRLVFMNGGSVGARATCVARISESLTGGDVKEAEALFDENVKDGVAGLMQDETEPIEADEVKEEDADTREAQEVSGDPEDPSVKAMQAADSLDRETAELQDDAAETGHKAVDGPPSVTSEVLEEQEPSARLEKGNGPDDIVRTVLTVPARQSIIRKSVPSRFPPQATVATSTEPEPAPVPENPATHSHRMEDETSESNYEDDEAHYLMSPGEDEFVSGPHTPAVFYGEACVVGLQVVTPVKTVRRVQSLMDQFPGRAVSAEWTASLPATLTNTSSEHELKRPASSDGRLQDVPTPRGFVPLTRAAFTSPSETTIQALSLPTANGSISTPKPQVYIDRGTDAGGVVGGGPEEDLTLETAEDSVVFEPVFPLVEDLVIHFTAEEADLLLSSVLTAYKNGTCPILPAATSDSTPVPESSSAEAAEEEDHRPMSNITAETDDDVYPRRHEFDPYAADNYSGNVEQWPSKSMKEPITAVQRPPSPAPTSPPIVKEVSNKFCEFFSENSSDIIGTQNSFRTLLGQHFPIGENGYSQFYFPISSAADRLWKPVFDDNDVNSKERGNVDRIIAFGSEEGVKEDFFNQVSAQVEKLGVKREGPVKSTKIDIDFFIANVIQAQQSSVEDAQLLFDPLADPELLATLLVPHLEAYLAINTTTRLLILQWSSKHLATVIALRTIVGPGILKIAGIMDSLSSDPPSRLSSPRNSSNNLLSNEATMKRATNRRSRDQLKNRSSVASQLSHHSAIYKPKKAESPPSFAKADYLLPSVATDAEISTFLSGIWTSLMEVSTFYTPEPEPEPAIVEKVVEKIVEKIVEKPTPVPVGTAMSLRHTESQRSTSKLARLTGERITPNAPPTPKDGKSHKYASSISSTIRTTFSERGRREDARIEKEWENFYIGEEDSEDDDYDRMILGRSMARIVPEVKVLAPDGKPAKRSTKKALKWLGLA